MKKIALIAVLSITTLLTACGKSDAWYIGHCAAGQLNANGMSNMPALFVRMGFSQVAKKTGLSMEEMEKGYVEYIPGSDYSHSCKVAREIENGNR